MLRLSLLALAIAAAAPAAAQEQTGDPVDFMLRPSDDLWADQLETGVSEDTEAADAGFGVPLAGPTGEEPVGPPLAGPTVTPPEPPPQRRPPPADRDDPFAPTGISAGAFVIRPAIEIGVRATDNPAGAVEKENAVGLIIAPEINIRSGDDRHEIEADLRGEAILYGEDRFDEREASARLRARYDLTSRTSVEAAVGYSYELDRFTDPDTPDAAVERPAVHDFDASLGLTQRFGRLGVTGTGTVERSVHEDVPLANGGTASRAELNDTEIGFRLRTSYEATGTLTPFAEAALGRDMFDHKRDDDGFERSNSWGELRGGLIFDRGEKLSGEVSVGWRHEDVDDERLEDLDAFVADASILWSPRRLTEVRFDLSTETQPTSLDDASGSVLYSGTLTLARRLGARWRLEAGAGLEYERFVGAGRTDVTYSGFAGVSYAINRIAALEARYAYERTESDAADADTDENVVSLRLRLQR